MRTIDAKLLLDEPAPKWAEEHMRSQYAEIERLRTDLAAWQDQVDRMYDTIRAAERERCREAVGVERDKWTKRLLIERASERERCRELLEQQIKMGNEAAGKAVAAERERCATEITQLQERIAELYRAQKSQVLSAQSFDLDRKLEEVRAAERERCAEIAGLEGARAAAMDDPCATALEHQAQRIELAIRKGE